MTAVELLNLALFKIGVSNSIAATTDQTREAFTGGAVYDHTLRATLRHFPWSFATKYAALTLVEGPAPSATSLVQAWSSTAAYAIGDVVDSAGTRYYAVAASTNQLPPNGTYWSTTPTTQANGDWIYAYRWPSDCLFARRIVNPIGSNGVSPSVFVGAGVHTRSVGKGRAFDRYPIPFRIGRDVNGLLVYSNQADAQLEYTMIDCDHLWADDLFIDAFTWRLAAYLAPSLSRMPNAVKDCYGAYEHTLARAAAVSTQEHQPEPNGEAEWIDGR